MDDSGAVTLEVISDAGVGSKGLAKRWRMEIELAGKAECKWRKTAARIESKYRNESALATTASGTSKFNILWSNVETISPALYNSMPTPDVRRRYRDDDKIGKAASEVLERALEFAMDAYDFNDLMKDAILDSLLVGRGVARVRYIPKLKTLPMPKGLNQGVDSLDDENDTYEDVEYEMVDCELVNWEDFRRGPGKRWRDVTWVAFRSRPDRKELIEKFGELGKNLELDDVDDSTDEKNEDKVKSDREIFKRGEVWEIWDREERKVIFLAPKYKDAPLKVEDDPLGLDKFFPMPQPIYSIRSTKDLIPIPEYTLYEDQAKELDRVTNRINKLINAIRIRGVYDSTISELKRLLDQEDGDYIPAENVTALIERGGLDKAIWTMPVDVAAQALGVLYTSRDQIKQVIYEITGISDILRGASNPNETATAQGIKSKWGTIRLQRRQDEVQRFARDILRLKAEIVAEKFQPQTVMEMTNLKFLPQAQKMLMQQQVQMQQQPMQPGMPPPPQMPPEMLEMMSKPSMEEVFGFLRDNAHRQFRIDIETDSTIAEIVQQDQAGMTELLTGLVGFMQGVAPAVQSGMLPVPAAKALLMTAVRRFRMGSEVEDELDKIPDEPPQLAGNGDADKAALQAERAGMQAEMQAKEGEIKLKELGMKIQEKAMALDVREQQMGIREQEIGLRDQVTGVREGQIAQRETGVSETEAGVTELQESVTSQVQEIVAQAQQDMASQMQEFMSQIAQMQAADSAKTHADMLQVITGMVSAMTAPKRIVRDAAGRAAGVETVQ
jgi:hypothetical protein